MLTRSSSRLLLASKTARLCGSPLQIPTDAKVELIRRLVASGLQAIEATAFVSPKWVPQLADAPEVMQRLPHAPNTTFSVLAPNVKVCPSQRPIPGHLC